MGQESREPSPLLGLSIEAGTEVCDLIRPFGRERFNTLQSLTRHLKFEL